MPLAVVAANARSASQLAEEMRFFAPADLPIAVFPDWETLPYDLFSPHPDIVSKRLQLLAELPEWKRGILVVDLETLLQRRDGVFDVLALGLRQLLVLFWTGDFVALHRRKRETGGRAQQRDAVLARVLPNFF